MDKFNPREFPVNYFSDYGKTPVDPKENTKSFIKNVVGQNENDMSKVAIMFFSDENLEIINKNLVLRVFEFTDKKVQIPFQSRNDLLVVMNHTYVNYAMNLENDIEKQVYKLNCRVVNEILPSLISEVKSYMLYLEEIEKNEKENRQINDLPISTKLTRGTTELPAMSDIFMK
tara:strand:+ start:1165 stop:1683 length:519 start_codon:yes stop_codon:yes gene_type:complete